MSERPEDLLAGVDAPRPLPARLRARLEDVLVTGAAPLPDDLDAPRPMPPGLRGRIEAALIRGGRDRRPAVLGIAAVVALVVAIAAAALFSPRQTEPPVVVAGPTTTGPAVTAAPPAAEGPARAPGGAAVATGRAAAPGRTSSGASSGAEAATSAGSTGTAPPFAFRQQGSSSAAPARAEAGASTGDASPAPSGDTGPAPAAAPAGGPALRVAVAGGAPAQEAGFKAYVDLLNRSGGIGGRPIEPVALKPGAATPPEGALVTVNLGATPLGAAFRGTRLETLAIDEPALKGEVHGVASAPERQARLAALEVFRQDSPGATAVIYTGRGVFAERVPAAIEGVLTDRGVSSVRVPFTGAEPVAARTADAVFLSLEPDLARSWAKQGGSAITATRGVAGVYSLLDPELARSLPNGTRVLSPYLLPQGDEGAAMARGLNRPLDAEVIHGWATSKHLAVALWRSGAADPAATARALDDMHGYDGGLAPPFDVRPGTRSRTPDAALFTVQDGGLQQRGGFRRDTTT